MPVTALEHVHVLCAEPHWHTIDFFSDLHLDSTQPATLQALQRYLQHSPAQALFILGDLFETWIGDDVLSHRPTGFEAQVCALLAETAQQRELFCLHGNRDFLLGPDFAAASHVRLLPDPTVLVFAQQRWLLTHGDALCVDDLDYQHFRQLVRAPAWQRSFVAQPLATRQAQAQAMRQRSQEHQNTQSELVDVDTTTALAWLHTSAASHLIHGHTHHPGEHTLAPGYQRHVLSDWDMYAQPPRGDVLRLNASGLQRVPLTPS